MPLLIRNAQVLAPESRGRADILIAGDRILAVGPDLTAMLPDMEVIDAADLIATPGFIDLHMHVTGGGGVGGPMTRAPEVEISELIAAGTTSVAGVLGTDVMTRSLKNLLAKVRAIQAAGLNAWMYTSNYRFPPTTLTKSVMDDLFCIPECLGVKVALGDDYGSFPDTQSILSLLSDIRLAGTLVGKKGLLHVHLGELADTFELFKEIEARGFPLKRHVLPTHCGRSREILRHACAYARDGGMIDFTTGGGCACEPAALSVMSALDAGVPYQSITLSTDAHGVKPKLDALGRTSGFEVIRVAANLETVRDLAGNHNLPLPQALSLITRNPAEHLGLVGHGVLEAGAIANLCLLTDELIPCFVISRGRTLMSNGEVLVSGLYEH